MGQSTSSIRTLVVCSMCPLNFSRRKRICSCVFSLIFILLSTKLQTVVKLLLKGGEPKINVLEVSTTCWKNHSKVTIKLGSLW